MKRAWGGIIAAAAVISALSLTACDETPLPSEGASVSSAAESQENSTGIGDIYGRTLESTQKKLGELLGAELEATSPGLFSDNDDEEHRLLRKEDSGKIAAFSYRFNAIDVAFRNERSYAVTFAAMDYDSDAVGAMKDYFDDFYGTDCAGETNGIYTWDTEQDGMVMLYASSDMVILQFALKQ